MEIVPKKKSPPLTVGVTYNLKRIVPDHEGHNDKEAEFDSESTVHAIANAISHLGHRVVKMEATAELPTQLAATAPDLVFNIAEGIKGRNRESQVPALLELLDIEYTGSDAATMALTLDKLMAKKIVSHAGILTPNFFQMVTGKEKIPRALHYPLIMKPVAEGSSKGIFNTSVVFDEASLKENVALYVSKYKQPMLIEEYIRGREFTVALLGGKKPRVLPPMEIVFLNAENSCPVYSFQHKLNLNSEVHYQNPAQLSARVKENIERVAKKCFEVLGCRDVARIDLRMDEKENIYFLECNPLPGLTPDWSDLCLIANGAGIDYLSLVKEILSPAIKRLKDKSRLHESC